LISDFSFFSFIANRAKKCIFIILFALNKLRNLLINSLIKVSLDSRFLFDSV